MNLKFITAPDSFKGTMSSTEVCAIMEKAILSVFPGAQVLNVPIADGGEGTVEAFLTALGGTWAEKTVTGPLFSPVKARYGLLPGGKCAVIEMAAASGLVLAEKSKNPLETTSFGTGELVADALHKGCEKIVLGIGGSATNDGGAGLAAALGVRFLNREGQSIPLNGGGLSALCTIDASGLDPAVKNCEILVACDVDNPLCGQNGASYVYGPQKGADSGMVRLLDSNLSHFADVLQKTAGNDVRNIPGTGAAGGLGASAIAFLGARLLPGIEIILDMVGFEGLLHGASLVFTGEGKIDGQSLRGKVPVGVAKRAKAKGVPVVAVVGDVGDGCEGVYEAGIDAVFSINQKAVPFEEARKTSRQDLARTMENLLRLYRLQEG